VNVCGRIVLTGWRGSIGGGFHWCEIRTIFDGRLTFSLNQATRRKRKNMLPMCLRQVVFWSSFVGGSLPFDSVNGFDPVPFRVPD